MSWLLLPRCVLAQQRSRPQGSLFVQSASVAKLLSAEGPASCCNSGVLHCSALAATALLLTGGQCACIQTGAVVCV